MYAAMELYVCDMGDQSISYRNTAVPCVVNIWWYHMRSERDGVVLESEHGGTILGQSAISLSGGAVHYSL